MNIQKVTYFAAAGMVSIACFFGITRAQEPSSAVIRTETKLVLVDAVVTDKKGAYVHNLSAKDFKVFEDNKEQQVKTFSFEADPASPSNSQPRYIVLFFDNSTMNLSDQGLARKAAVNFIQANAGPNRLMAIVNFGGSLQIAQNFTTDAERLKSVASGLQISMVNPTGASSGTASLSGAYFNYGVRDVVLGLRSLAKGLASVPGRKTLIFLTAGFPVDGELLPEVTATIDVCNRSNVAVYPIDVRGLVGYAQASPDSPGEQPVSFVNAFFQKTGSPPSTPKPGAGGGGGGTRSPGTSSGSSAKSFGAGAPSSTINGSASRILIPPFPPGASNNQEIMYMLANGTGGFVIVNTNDLLGGLDRIGKEQNEFYLIGYTPPESEDGSCHNLKVKVDMSGTTVRARTGYCSAKSNNSLAKTQTEKTLEARAASQQAGTVPASLEAPFFYTSANVARVNVAMEISTASVAFEKEKGKFHSVINVLGIAQKPDGSVGGRFSDKVNLEFDTKKEVEAFQKTPYHYENQFDIASGKYKLAVSFSAGKEAFGVVSRQLVVEPYESKQFAMSALTFSTRFVAAGGVDSGLDAELLADRTPLVSRGIRVYPSGTNTFKTSDKTALYLEIYEPFLLEAEVPKDLALAIQVKVLGQTSGVQKFDSGMVRVPMPEKAGNPAIPIATQIPVASLGPGAYRLIVEATDSKGLTRKRWADFAVE
jgi:VWFA-related protein